jgi:hypothetical protein
METISSTAGSVVVVQRKYIDGELSEAELERGLELALTGNLEIAYPAEIYPPP